MVESVFGLGVLLLTLVGSSLQELCANTCDCNISTDEPGGVHNVKVRCSEGSVSWYNPFGALQLTINPSFKRSGTFSMCFVLESGSALLKVSREAEISFNSKSPHSRSQYLINDSGLETITTSEGRSKEHCVTSQGLLKLFIEPASPASVGAQNVKLHYDITEVKGQGDQASSIEECRPCNDEEILRAYCSSDFVVVGSMASVQDDLETESTSIGVDVLQIIRQKGSHFQRLRRDIVTLRGTVKAPKKCGISRGEGTFLFTGRMKFGELRVGCAPYLDEWESIARKAEMEGRMECTRD